MKIDKEHVLDIIQKMADEYHDEYYNTGSKHSEGKMDAAYRILSEIEEVEE